VPGQGAIKQLLTDDAYCDLLYPSAHTSFTTLLTQPFSRFPPLKNQTSDPTAACLQLYKLVEELSVALAASLPACLLVFYLVRLQGSVALFWLVHVVSIAVSTGAVLGSCLAGQTNWSIGEGGRLVSWRQRDGCSVDAYICEHARMLMQVPIATAGLP
jgi:hypothetical protein